MGVETQVYSTIQYTIFRGHKQKNHPKNEVVSIT